MVAAIRLKTPKPSNKLHPQLRSNRLTLAAVVLLVLWATRLSALDALPLHNDEGLHLTRAVEVWNGHPFWEIRDGKIINHWAIALFQPQNAPVFTGRIATVFITMLGMAAGLALARRVAGATASLITAGLWISSHYLFFYERLAFSDAEAGALVVLACWAALRCVDSGRVTAALLTGAALASAVLFKFTAAPFALSVLILLLFYPGTASRRSRLRALAIIAGIGVISLAVPTLYLLRRGEDVFSIALGWIGTGSTASDGSGIAAIDNLGRLGEIMTGFSGFGAYLVILIAGLLAALVLPRLRIVFLAWFAPLMVILVLGREVLPRHYVVGLPLGLMVAAVGIAGLTERLTAHQLPSMSRIVAPSLAALLLIAFVIQTQPGYRSPDAQIMPEIVRREHVTEHSGGFGLVDAMHALPSLTEADSIVIASMFPDSCRRANFYAQNERELTCTGAPGTDLIRATLAERGVVYVLTDTSPLIGADINALAAGWNVATERIGAFPRPGEDEQTAAVVLWRLNS